MLIAIIPTPNGPDSRTEVYGDNITEVCRAARSELLDQGFKHHKIVSVFEDGAKAGDLEFRGEYLNEGRFYSDTITIKKTEQKVDL